MSAAAPAIVPETELTTPTEYPICEHVRDNGHRCGSPALRGRHFCYYHSRAHSPLSRLGQRHYRAPVPETIESLQLIIQQVTESLGTGPITEKSAGKLLYAVQLATNLLKMQQGAPFKPSVGLSGVVADGTTDDPTTDDPSSSFKSPDDQITRSSDVVVDIPEAMQQVLDPPADPDPAPGFAHLLPQMAASVPIDLGTFERITANLMTEKDLYEARTFLLTGPEDPGYQENLRIVNAHTDAVLELEGLGMSTQHPRLRRWFPKVDNRRYIEPERKRKA